MEEKTAIHNVIRPVLIGLGLAISENMIELNGGHIDVESPYGEGTVFTLYLPVHEDA